MNTTQVSPSVDSHTEEPLWQELTEEEQEKICGGGKYVPGFRYFNGKRLIYVHKNYCQRLPLSHLFRPGSPILFG